MPRCVSSSPGRRLRAARRKTVGDRCGPTVDRRQSEKETGIAFCLPNATRDSLQKDDASHTTCAAQETRGHCANHGVKRSTASKRTGGARRRTACASPPEGTARRAARHAAERAGHRAMYRRRTMPADPMAVARANASLHRHHRSVRARCLHAFTPSRHHAFTPSRLHAAR